MPPKSSSRKIRKCHNDFRGMICVCCLAKIKAKWPKKVNESISSLIESHVYPNYQSHKEYLPTAICTKCRDLVNAQSELEIFPLVKYKELIENVKECQINANLGENAICLCELCRLGAVSALNVTIESSDFLIGMRNTKKGRLPIAKKVTITDLVTDEHKTKDEKLNLIVETHSPVTLQQLAAKIMRNEVIAKYYTEPCKTVR